MRSDERRSRLLQAGRELLAERGDINKVSITSLAKRADISVGALYFSYKTKEHLFADLLGLDLAVATTDGERLAALRRYVPAPLAAVLP